MQIRLIHFIYSYLPAIRVYSHPRGALIFVQVQIQREKLPPYEGAIGSALRACGRGHLDAKRLRARSFGPTDKTRPQQTGAGFLFTFDAQVVMKDAFMA